MNGNDASFKDFTVTERSSELLKMLPLIFLGVLMGGVLFALYDHFIGHYLLLSAGSYQFICMLLSCAVCVWVARKLI